jgi:hypothetical protein
MHEIGSPHKAAPSEMPAISPDGATNSRIIGFSKKEKESIIYNKTTGYKSSAASTISNIFVIGIVLGAVKEQNKESR